MLTLLIWIVITLVIAGLLTWLVGFLPIAPPQIKTIIIVIIWIVAVICIVYWLIGFAGGLPPPPHGRY